MQVVQKAITAAAKEIHHSAQSPGEDFTMDLALVHVAYSCVQRRLNCLSLLLQTKPDIIQDLLKTFSWDENEMVSCTSSVITITKQELMMYREIQACLCSMLRTSNSMIDDENSAIGGYGKFLVNSNLGQIHLCRSPTSVRCELKYKLPFATLQVNRAVSR